MAVAPLRLSAQTRLSERGAFYLSVDMLVGGATAAVGAVRAHRPVLDATLRGMAGGAVVHTGKRLVGTGEAAVRLAGVETVALGANMVRNASAPDGWFSDLVFPVYPFLVRRLSSRPGDRWSVRVSGAGVVGIVMSTRSRGTRFSLGQSLLASGAVFVTDAPSLGCAGWGDCLLQTRGLHNYGSTVWARGYGRADEVITHESIHMAQFVLNDVLYAEPASDFALGRLGRSDSSVGRVSRWLGRHVVVDAFHPLGLLNMASDALTSASADSFAEREATFFAGEDLCAARPGASCRSW